MNELRFGLRCSLLWRWEIRQHSNVHSNKRCEGEYEASMEEKGNKTNNATSVKNTHQTPCHIHLKSKQRTTTTTTTRTKLKANTTKRNKNIDRLLNINTSPFHSTTKWTQSRWECVPPKLEINELCLWASMFAPFEDEKFGNIQMSIGDKLSEGESNHTMEEKGNKTNKATSVKNTHQTRCHIHLKSKQRTTKQNSSRRSQQNGTKLLSLSISTPLLSTQQRKWTQSRWECVAAKTGNQRTPVLPFNVSPFGDENVHSNKLGEGSPINLWRRKETKQTKQNKSKNTHQTPQIETKNDNNKAAQDEHNKTEQLWRRRIKTEDINIPLLLTIAFVSGALSSQYFLFRMELFPISIFPLISWYFVSALHFVCLRRKRNPFSPHLSLFVWRPHPRQAQKWRKNGREQRSSWREMRAKMMMMKRDRNTNEKKKNVDSKKQEKDGGDQLTDIFMDANEWITTRTNQTTTLNKKNQRKKNQRQWKKTQTTNTNSKQKKQIDSKM